MQRVGVFLWWDHFNVTHCALERSRKDGDLKWSTWSRWRSRNECCPRSSDKRLRRSSSRTNEWTRQVVAKYPWADWERRSFPTDQKSINLCTKLVTSMKVTDQWNCVTSFGQEEHENSWEIVMMMMMMMNTDINENTFTIWLKKNHVGLSLDMKSEGCLEFGRLSVSWYDTCDVVANWLNAIKKGFKDLHSQHDVSCPCSFYSRETRIRTSWTGRKVSWTSISSRSPSFGSVRVCSHINDRWERVQFGQETLRESWSWSRQRSKRART